MRRWVTAIAVTLTTAVMASCSSGASTNGSTTADPVRPKIALGAVVADAELSGEAQRIPINDQQSILLAAGDAKTGTKLQVREVLNVDQHVGGVTVRDKVLDIAVRSGKLLGKIKVLYNVPNPPPGAPTPTAGELDRATGKWTRIAGTVYDANNERLEVPLTKSAAIGRLEWDWTNAIAGAATAASALVAQAEGTDPQCTGEDDVNNRYNVVVSTVASVAWCAGVEQGSDVLRVRNRGRLPVAIVASSGFSLSAPVSGPYAFVDELAGLLASNHAWPMPAGKAVQVIAPGSELTLSFVKGPVAAEVAAEVDAYSQQVAALAVAAEVATAIFAGQGMPTPALLSNEGQVRTSLFGKLTSTQCSDDFGPITQDGRRSADELAKFVGGVITGCIGNGILQELASTQPAATSQQRDNFAPSDPAQIPSDFADQIAAAVAPTINDLTQRLGLPQLSKVVMEQRAPTTTATTPPPTRPVTTAPVPDTTTVTTPVTSTPVTTETPTTPSTAPPAVTTAVTTPDTTTAPPATTTATTLPPTTVPPTEPTTTTTAVAPTTTPTSVLSTLSETSSAQMLCSGTGSSVTQPFVVPAGTTELDSVTIATDGVFTADLEIRSGDERLRTPNLVANGSTATASLHRLPVVAGSPLTVVITNVRHSADKAVPIRFTTTDVLLGTNATIFNRCPTVGTSLTYTDLSMEIFGR